MKKIISGDNSIENKPIYVISDLHIGDKSRKNIFVKSGREKLFERLLDHVEQENGQLIILGDFLELWWYKPYKVISSMRALLDRIDEMPVVFVPGNHDNEVLNIDETNRAYHPLFRKISGPFTQTIGSRRFRFMHGHEIDPFMPQRIDRCGRLFGSIAPVFRLTCCYKFVYSDFVSDLSLDVRERILKSWNKVSSKLLEKLEHYGPFPAVQVSFIKHLLQDKTILSRHYREKGTGFYDVVVSGHTHRAAGVDDWYYNSGSWMGSTNDFILIEPDGKTEVLQWTAGGVQFNNRLFEH